MNYSSCSSSFFLLPGLAVAKLGGVGGCVGVKKGTVNLNMSRTMLCPHIQIQVENIIEVRALFWLSALQERAESQKRLKASTSRVRMTKCQID